MKRKLDISYTNSSEIDATAFNDVNPWTSNPFSQNYYEILKKRMNLPVYGFKEDLIEKVKNNQVVIVEGMIMFITRLYFNSFISIISIFMILSRL